MRIGLLCSRVRIEEKLILAAFRERGVEPERVDPRRVVLGLGETALDGCDAVLVNSAIAAAEKPLLATSFFTVFFA